MGKRADDFEKQRLEYNDRVSKLALELMQHGTRAQEEVEGEEVLQQVTIVEGGGEGEGVLQQVVVTQGEGEGVVQQMEAVNGERETAECEQGEVATLEKVGSPTSGRVQPSSQHLEDCQLVSQHVIEEKGMEGIVRRRAVGDRVHSGKGTKKPRGSKWQRGIKTLAVSGMTRAQEELVDRFNQVGATHR